MHDPNRSTGGVWCPACGRLMRLRFSRSGASAGCHFWGCSSYPSCTGTRGVFDLLEPSTFEWHAVVIAATGRSTIRGLMLTVRDGSRLIDRLCAVKAIALVDDPLAAEALQRCSALRQLPGVIARAVRANPWHLRRDWPLARTIEALGQAGGQVMLESPIDPWIEPASSTLPTSREAPRPPTWAATAESAHRRSEVVARMVLDLEVDDHGDDELEPLDYDELTRAFGDPDWYDEVGRPPGRPSGGSSPRRPR